MGKKKNNNKILGLSKGKFIAILFGVVILLSMFLSRCDNTDVNTTTESYRASPVKEKTIEEKNDEVLAKAQAEFDLRSVASEYTAEAYPETYKKWGDAWMTRVNQALYPAVIQASKNSKCDKPNQIGISDKSTPKKELIFYVNCDNLEQIIVSEEVALKGGTTFAKTDILIKDDDYYKNKCKELIKSTLSNPSTFKQNVFSTEVIKAKNGNIRVDMPFKMKNGIGTKFEKHGRCIFSTSGDVDAMLLNK